MAPRTTTAAPLSDGRVPEAASTTSFRLGHHTALDGVRGLAILGVLACHAQGARGVKTWGFGGLRGVNVFFVLSGFLITSLLVEEHQATAAIRIGRFYARRALRLLPALLALLAACAVAFMLAPHSALTRETVKTAPFTLFYVENWLSIVHHYVVAGALDHTWSLSVEEQFYLVWPLLLLGALRWLPRRSWLTGAALGGTLLSMAWSAKVSTTHGGTRLFGTDIAAHGLLIGCALGAWLHFATPERRSKLGELTRRGAPFATAYLLIAFTAFGAPSQRSSVLETVDLVAVEVAAAVLIGFLVLGRDSAIHRAFSTRSMVTIGVWSYAIYLWHLPILKWLIAATGNNNLSAVLMVPLSFGVAALSRRYVEAPFLRLKERLH